MIRALAQFARADVRRAPLRFASRLLRYEMGRTSLARRERLTELCDGLVVSVRTSDEIERAIWLYGFHDYPALVVFRALVSRGMNVIDVGAHVGEFALVAARRASPGRVIAVEPNPSTRERLLANIERNALSNVEVVDVALADTPGIAVLRVPSWAPGNTGVASLAYEGPAAAEVRVRRATLDEIVAEWGLTAVDAIKIDVEGLETAVMRGGAGVLERWKPAIVFEADDLLFDRAKGTEAVTFLRGFGYLIYGIERVRGGFRLKDILPESDLGAYRHARQALNLVAVHPLRAPESGEVFSLIPDL